ncbi:hypothetical protein AOLI_G00199520 [Acnodon oligacanthus]
MDHRAIGPSSCEGELDDEGSDRTREAESFVIYGGAGRRRRRTEVNTGGGRSQRRVSEEEGLLLSLLMEVGWMDSSPKGI